jgi:hypothetical protein
VIVNAFLRPQSADQLDLFAKTAHAPGFGHAELLVVVLAPQPNPKDCPSAAQPVERRPLMRHRHRTVDRQHNDRRTEPNPLCHRCRVGQRANRIEAGDVVQRVLGDPEVAKPERLGALRHRAHRRHIDRIGRTVWQRHAERDLILQCHAKCLQDLDPTPIEVLRWIVSAGWPSRSPIGKV